MSKKSAWMPPASAELYEVAEVMLDDADNFFRNWLDAGRRQLALSENYRDAMRSGTDAAARSVMALAAKNLDAGFQFAHKLMQARDVGEIFALQLQLYRKQFEAFAAQLRDVSEAAIAAAERAS